MTAGEANAIYDKVAERVAREAGTTWAVMGFSERWRAIIAQTPSEALQVFVLAEDDDDTSDQWLALANEELDRRDRWWR